MTQYAIQYTPNSSPQWRIHRMDDHHGSYLGFYTIIPTRDHYTCDCPSPYHHNCKHIQMLLHPNPELQAPTP